MILNSKISVPIGILLFIVFHTKNLQSQILNEYIDLQVHPTMHLQYKFFGKGLQYFDANKPPKLSYKHQFKNICYANYFQENKGARIFVNGAINREYINNSKKAKRKILKQIDYINNFANENAEFFVVAKSPQEVRDYINNSNKTVFIHSIEGGRKLINSQQDADFWASQGVAFFTLIHLADCEYGGAAIAPTTATKLINFKAPKGENENGLTEKGKQSIVWLANAGIMTDITHMNDKSRRDALQVMEQHNIPPLSTHDGFKPIQNSPRALSEEDILRVYKNNGFISLPISGFSCKSHHPHEKYQKAIDSLDLYCESSIDSYLFTYLAVKDFIENHPELAYSEKLTELEKVDYCIGFQSDFNGWLNHSRPRIGKDGCFPAVEGENYEEIELIGMPHPALLESQWKYFEKKNADTTPIRRSSEKFIQLWEYFNTNKGKF
jgi:microsomal dipeptidase-like Zn-dependent dipeptidase